EFDNFVQSRIPQDIPVNVVHDGWNEGITAFYTNDKKSAQAAFKQVVNANPQFQGAQDFLNASNPGSNGNRTLAPTPPVSQGGQGNIISFLLPLIGIAVLVVLVGLLLLASVLFGRSRLRRKREIREALAEAPLQARRIKEMEAMQQEREQPVGARPNNPGVDVGRNAAASPHRTAPLPAQDWRCPRCSEPVPAGANYCSRCRLPLSPSESGLHLKVAPQQSLPQSDIPAAPVSPALSPAGVPASYPLAQFPPFSPSPPSAGSVADQPTLDMSSADQPTLDMSPTLQGNKTDDADMPTVPYVMQRRQRPLGYSIVTRTNRGIKRQHKPNEDSLVAATGGRMSNHALQLFGLFVVADGMGGHANGQDASRLAIQTIVNYILPELMRDTGQQSDGFRRILKEGVEHANIAVHQQNLEQHGDMGTTITAALTVETTAYIANVGDSRTYLYRQAEGLIKITQDHSVVASLVDAGIIKPDDIYTHPKRNQIYRSLGEKPAIEVDTFVVQLQEGDRLLLCSDGLWDMVRDPQISDVIRSTAGNLELMGDALIQAALDGGGEDNVSIILVQVAETAQRPLKAGVQFLARPDTMQVPQID
ncbi:MAG: protein phosphatase 2C domain-containing protein, partial [Ktedonobacteraceae bacterium]|nr:protein phosphatase 2C domain-containing protein [Ktedonobacteraceae bacterium]